MRAVAMLGAVVVLTAMTACGTSDSSGGNPTASASAVTTKPLLQVGPARDFGDACKLLSASDVQSATNAGPVTPGSRTDPQLGSFCTYTLAGGTGVPLLNVQVEVLRTTAEAKGTVDASGGPALSGIGDDARASKPGGLGSAVYLSKGATYAVLSSVHKDVTPAELQKLATTLAGRLS
ncbi:MAG TPA: hypothetical protein VH134_02180 [Candidatus Dormibacteraeota bacterium]|nr:hypothetical protein [Candidatus Dormibacteraeota bacterium]